MLTVALTFVFSSIFLSSIAEAGLINYNRRNGDVTNAGAAPARTRSTSYGRRGPAWEARAPKADNRTEQRYDINKDGTLQPAEVRMFLREVVDFVESRGGMRINSEILREYDSNGDGVISQSELGQMRDHIGR